MKQIHKKRKNTEPHLWRSLIYGFFCNVAFVILILLVFTKISLMTDDPSKVLLPLALSALVLSGFGAGFFSAKFYRRQGPSIGVLAGVLWAVLLLLMSFAVDANPQAISWLRWLSYPLVLLFATAGGMAGKGKQRNYHRHI